MKKKNKKVQLFIFLFLIGIIILIIYTKTSTATQNDIKYSKEAVTVMKEKNIYEKIKEKEYSEIIEKMILNDNFNSKHLDAYYEIKNQEREDFTNLVNLFLDKNYNPTEINSILEYLNDKNINKLKEMDHIDLKDYVKVSNVEVDKIDRYNVWVKEKNSTIEDAVTKVNIGLDQEFYTEIETIKNPSSYTVLLNKYRGLPEDYVPDDLTSLSINKNYKLRAEAANAYEQLQSAALLDNVKVIPFSAYRSKAYQANLYTNYVKRDGKNAADTYSARPRHSEHELGLAIDIRSSSLSDNLTDDDYKWMLNNSYKYGFIVRYAKGTTPITGYIEEPWHLRFLGIDVATDVHNKGITFDEYYDLYLKNNE